MTTAAVLGIPSHLGYVALGVLVALESMGLPLPGEAALVTSGVLAHEGRLSIELVVAVAAIAAIIGDNLGYLLGARGGRRLLERDGRLAGHRRRFLAAGERFYERHGPKAVFLARWVFGARVTAAWLAGVNRMPWRTFMVFNALGGILWALTVGTVGYLLGAAGARIVQTAGVGALVVLVAAAATALELGWRRRRRAARATTVN
jgi:membrane protein DedA with SNARE-associated domain